MNTSKFYDNLFLKKIDLRPSISKRIVFNEICLLIDQLINKSQGNQLSLLDVGCGAGHLIRMLLKKPNLKLMGIDITDEVIRCLQKKYAEPEFLMVNFSEQKRAIKSFDILTAVEILEHIPYPKQETFIQNCQGSLREGGKLFLTTPNLDRAHRIPYQYRTTQPVEDWLTNQQLKELLEKYFDDVTITSCVWFFPNRYIDAIFKRITYPFHMTIEQNLLRTTNLGGHLVATATKRKREMDE